jgi:hypothetical protein
MINGTFVHDNIAQYPLEIDLLSGCMTLRL